jgi:hypothetical protein
LSRYLFPNTRQDKLKAGKNAEITWQTSSKAESALHDVLISTDGGKTFTSIATNLPGTSRSFDFVVPPAYANVKKARIRVIATDIEGNTAQDDSDEVFPIKKKK